jgi:P-type Cu2+ transporter
LLHREINMATTAVSDSTRYFCAHCGLPVTALTGARRSDDLFCCRACRIASMMIGRQEHGTHRMNLLRLGIGVLLAMNIMMISLLLYAGSIDQPAVPAFRLILLALAAPALIILIPPFLDGALQELRRGVLSLDTLIAGGSLSAFTLSAVNAVRGSGEIYFDTATMLPVLVTVGKIIEASAKTKASDLLHGLELLLPKMAVRISAVGSEEVGIALLRPGDLVRVRPGERVPVDGVIIEGRSSIDEAAFTGEFLPRSCSPGESVIAGTVNGTGPLVIRAEKTGDELLLHRMVAMIQDAWQNPADSERIAQRAAALFIPVVLTVAVLSLLCWTLLGSADRGLLSALSVLVVACPCTMGIATPLATSLAIARAARGGVIVRGGRVMEQLAGTEMFFFDKTGTITTGKPVVGEIITFAAGTAQGEVLGWLAALETGSEHPLARAVLDRAADDGVEAGTARGVEVIPGSGLAGEVTWNGVRKNVTAGTLCFVGGDRSPAVEGNSTAIDVGWDGELKGRLLVTDTIRPEAASCIEQLASLGIASLLLSGDRFPAASSVGAAIGIHEVYAPRSPAQKVEAISAAVAAGRAVAMVGDGINDAPALAAAQTGIALGGGMDLAKQAANVVILSGSLMQIPWLIALGKRTGRIIRGNFAWSFAYNAIALAVAACGLLHPLLAAVLMVFSSVTVLGNSLRIAIHPTQEETWIS